MTAATRPWWLRCHGRRISTAENNIAWYIGPFSLNWDHEFKPYDPAKGFGWLPQPRRTFRIWLDLPFRGRPFHRVLQLTFWRDTGHYCECGMIRGFCTDKRQHAARIEQESVHAY